VGIQASFIEIKHLEDKIIGMNQEKDDSKAAPQQVTPQENRTSGGIVEASLREFKKSKAIPQPLIWLIALALVLSLLVGGMLSYVKKTAMENTTGPLVRLESSETYANFDQEQLRSYFSGVWSHQTEDVAMSLSMVDDKFELIVAPARVPGVRYFVRGTFFINGDVLILEKKNNLGYSYDPDKRWLRYIPIPMNNVNIRYELVQRDMIWTLSDEESEHIRGGVNEFFSGKNNKVEWKKR